MIHDAKGASSDLVTELRAASDPIPLAFEQADPFVDADRRLMGWAADEIERLRAGISQFEHRSHLGNAESFKAAFGEWAREVLGR